MTRLFVNLMILSVSVFVFSKTHAAGHVVEDLGVVIDLPDDWIHDGQDSFGYVILPKKDGGRIPKMRIHGLSYRDITTDEAVKKGLEKINARKKTRHQLPETLLGTMTVVTAGGIKGTKSMIGPGEYYLDRYYFKLKDGRMFCVCVYKSAKWPEFAAICEDAIKQTLRLKPESN